MKYNIIHIAHLSAMTFTIVNKLNQYAKVLFNIGSTTLSFQILFVVEHDCKGSSEA